MPRKTAGASGTAKAGKAKLDDVASPPLTNDEFVSAFKAYCVEKGASILQGLGTGLAGPQLCRHFLDYTQHPAIPCMHPALDQFDGGMLYRTHRFIIFCRSCTVYSPPPPSKGEFYTHLFVVSQGRHAV